MNCVGFVTVYLTDTGTYSLAGDPGSAGINMASMSAYNDNTYVANLFLSRLPRLNHRPLWRGTVSSRYM